MATTDLSASEVILGTSNAAGIFIAPTGSTLPTDTTTALSASWDTLGYLSDDGVTIGSSTDSEDVKAWQSKSAIRTIVTGKEITLEFTMLQVNPRTMALYFDQGAPEAIGDSFSLDVRADTGAIEYAVCIDTRDGDNVIRYVFPRASLSDNGDIEIQSGQAQGYPVTLKALADNGLLCSIIKGAAPSDPYVPSKGAAAPGDVFSAEVTITASDSTRALLLAGLGYVADPLTAWDTGEGITIGGYAFHWSGTAWAAGVAS